MPACSLNTWQDCGAQLELQRDLVHLVIHDENQAKRDFMGVSRILPEPQTTALYFSQEIRIC
jgi:hypothetical protein